MDETLCEKGRQMSTSTPTRRSGQPYQEAALGFRNYWYPALMAKEVGRRPVSLTMLGDRLAFFRRGDRVFATKDECPHRGTPLSLGKDEFPDTRTIACRYHGWVFDLTDGRCVGALTDGPDSPVVGRIRVKTYPVEERKGVLWVWMGERHPAPVEEDIPRLLARDDTRVRVVKGVTYGNWRAHAENIGYGHAPMLHRDSLWVFTRQNPAYMRNYTPYVSEDLDGEWVVDRSEEVVRQAEYPGLGTWPTLEGKPWRYRKGGRLSTDLFGLRAFISLGLPGINRVLNFPLRGGIYYEFYVPVDEDHYRLWQVTCTWPKNPIDAVWQALRYYVWGRPAGVGRFIGQDKVMVRHASDYAKRQGFYAPSPKLYRPDAFQALWQDYANRRARGVGWDEGAPAGTPNGTTASTPEAKEEAHAV